MNGLSTSMIVAAAGIRDARCSPSGEDAPLILLARACLHQCGAQARLLLRLVDCRTGRALLRVVEWLSVPGISAHYAWRKSAIRAWVDGECHAGARQIVILGSGFDGLGQWLLRRHRCVRVVEIDRTETVRTKAAAASIYGLHDPQWVLAAADLSKADLTQVLRAIPGFDPRQPTVVVAEGLLMYLPYATVHRVLSTLAAYLPDARLVATGMERQSSGRVGFRYERPWVRAWLAWRGESFRWGIAAGACLPGPRASRFPPLPCFALEQAGSRDASPDPSPGEWLVMGRLVADCARASAPTA